MLVCMDLPSTLGDTPAHYDRLKLHPTEVAPWEDGLRTDPSTRSLEWWYYDCRLEDGTRLTIELHTKPPLVSPSSPLMPFLSVVMLRPDGALVVKSASFPADHFHASAAGCDVHMGPSYCRGDLAQHEVHVEIDDLVLDLTLTSELAPWRPASGHFYLGAAEEKHFAWLLVMARARVTAVITTGDRREELAGVGYHDHNWGNAAPASIVDHWYWGHAHLGDYTIVTLRAVSHAKYGKRAFPAFLLARGSEVLAQGTDGLELAAFDESIEPSTGVPVAGRLAYRIRAGDAQLRLDFVRRRDVLALGFGDAGGYLRFVGDARLEHVAGAGSPEVTMGEGLWEVLSFGPRQSHHVATR